MNRQISKEETQMANEYMKECSTYLATKEIHIRTRQEP
jgi:hypothetical protein